VLVWCSLGTISAALAGCTPRNASKAPPTSPSAIPPASTASSSSAATPPTPEAGAPSPVSTQGSEAMIHEPLAYASIVSEKGDEYFHVFLKEPDQEAKDLSTGRVFEYDPVWSAASDQ